MGLYVKTKYNQITNISLLTQHVASMNKQWQEGSRTQQVPFQHNVFQLRCNMTNKTHKNLRTYISSN